MDKLQIVKEGDTEFFVPKVVDISIKKGPGTKQKDVFYNPAMEFNRDISILICQWFVSQSKKKNVKILDGLAASGARGVRIANEVEGKNFTVAINDRNRYAFEVIKKNIEHNRLENAVALKEDLNVLLQREKFDYVDVDPFGSPAEFVDSAVKSIFHNGVLACTATDTAPLCGVYPRVCLRRYFAKPLHNWMMHEVGLRILIGFIGREAAKYDVGVKPVLCYYADHYFRIYLRILRGVRYANETMGNIVYLNLDSFTLSEVPVGENFAGPLWGGVLHDKKAVGVMLGLPVLSMLNTSRRITKFFSILVEELDDIPFFYRVDELSSKLKVSPPKLSKLLEAFRNLGYRVSRTHFSSAGFKTDAPLDVVERVFKNIR
jgi:tRNA (guanine26-N2/guanine27-N2)-dimethyltransferase